jgi:hypothetical protein
MAIACLASAQRLKKPNYEQECLAWGRSNSIDWRIVLEAATAVKRIL